MKKSASLIILSILLFSFVQKDKKTLAVFEQIDSYVSSFHHTYQTLTLLTENGHRLTGTSNGRNAEKLVYDELVSNKLATKFQEFETKAWARKMVKLNVVPSNSDNYREVDAVALAHSPVAAKVNGVIVDCGDGLASDFGLIDDLHGKVALFNIGIRNPKNQGQKNLHRSEKTALAIAKGASGVIIVNGVEGGVLLTGTASVTGELIPIPAVCISLESGAMIRKWIEDEKNIEADIDMLNTFKPVTARNVIATYPPSSKNNNEVIVVGAHLDSWDLATGAVDNGLGASTVIELAKLFKRLKLKTKRPIQFVLFMGEEQGLLGSKHYVAQAIENKTIGNIALMMNMDMLNDTKGFNSFGNSELQDLIEKTSEMILKTDSSYKNQHSKSFGLHSDHQPFMLAGVNILCPAGRLSKETLNCYHADCDNINLVVPEELENNLRYCAMMLYALANTPALPKQKTSDETRDYLILNGLKDELVLGKEWKWSN